MPKKLPTSEEHHEELVNGLYEQMKEIMETSTQPICIYLDDNHKACNSKFSMLLGYKSPRELAETPGFLEPFVAKKSHDIVSENYQKTAKHKIAYALDLTFKKKDESTFDATLIHVPMMFEGHFFVLLFVSNVVK